MAQKKKKPKVVLKKKQVIVLAATIVAVCACMLTVAIITSPQSATPDAASVSQDSSSREALANPAAMETAPPQDDGVAQVVAQLEAAERRAKEAERRASEAEKRAKEAEKAAEREKNAAEQASVREKTTAERLAAEKSRAEKLAAEKAASSKTTASSGTPKESSTASYNGGASSSQARQLAMGGTERAGTPPSTGSASAGQSAGGTAVAAKDYTIPAARPGATLVFVLDDGGQSLSDLQHYLNLPFPVAVAVLPQLSHSVEAARRVRASGRHELLLHQPMQAINLSVDPGPGAITPTMTTTEIDAIVRKNLLEIGPVAGMNNHEGSLITESKVKVGKVIEICQKQGIFFLDSRTTSATAAPQAALELGAKIWERDVFLDNTQKRADILEQIQRGLAVANKKGYAIMIGHVWSGSNLAQIMQELYPVLKAQGYSFSTVGGLYENFGS